MSEGRDLSLTREQIIGRTALELNLCSDLESRAWPLLRARALIAPILLAAAGFIWIEIALFPALDQAASARILWAASHPDCAPVLPRGMLWGLYYYSGKRLPNCAIVDKNAVPLNGSPQTH